MSTPPFPNMDELLQRLLDDQIEPDEMQRLAKAIREDPRVREYYIDSLLVSAVVRRSSQVTGELSKSDLIRRSPAAQVGAAPDACGDASCRSRRSWRWGPWLWRLSTCFVTGLKARRSARWPAPMKRDGGGLIRDRANRCTPAHTI